MHKAASALSVYKEKNDETFLYSRISNRTSANMCPAIEFSIHDPESIYSDMEYPLPLSSKDRGDLELVPYYNEHPLVNEAIRQVEQLQKQQEKKKHRDVAR